jgi:hypothetical protein
MYYKDDTMNLEDLSFLRVFAGITFGPEIYLNKSRAEAFVDKVNTEYPNLFPRYEILTPRQPIVMINVDEMCECIVSPKSMVYRDYKGKTKEEFLKITIGIISLIMDLFALKDIRRIGKVQDFFWEMSSPQQKIPKAFTHFDDNVEISRLHTLVKEEGKNINLNYFAFQEGKIELFGGEIEFNVPTSMIISCDVNNTDMSEPLEDILKTLEEIFTFADNYVNSTLIEKLNKHLGDIL